ncbi:MAG: glycoside hydrolase family 3 C-terminal domain-containing protein [Candidatus Thermoplasmatota archaeon]|nr:glycoside hydrolase family 3 C-terminal domain-containing protein [Candidatus Thermoplasmatota archaeon]
MKAKLLALAMIGMMFATTFAGTAGASVDAVPAIADVVNVGASAAASDVSIYKDPNQPVDARVEDLLSRMTLDEKIEQMHGNMADPETMSTIYNSRLGIPGFNFSDGPRGERWGYTTTFPVGIACGATWNEGLEYLVGVVMGNETSARGRDVIFAPCMNLVRDSHGGRSQETYGEDTWHVGRMGVALIEGIQSEGAMACAKHYAANSDENNRHQKNSILDPRTLYEIYLPHFKMAVVEADVASVMPAYNRLNGEYCAGNYQLLRQILKGEWGFDGLTVSDWFGTEGPIVEHIESFGGPMLNSQLPINFIKMVASNTNPNATGIKSPTPYDAIQAGLDVEMPEPYLYNYEFNVLASSGQIQQYLIDDAVRRILRAKFEYGLFDEPKKANDAFVETPEHIALTREVEHEAAVLLKNDGNTLPFDIGAIKSIAVIGPAADDKDRLGDHGSSNAQPTPEKLITTLMGIKNKVGSGVKVSYDNGSDPAAAAELAKTCDAAVVVVGRNYLEEAEAKDLDSLALSGTQPELINAVCSANKNSVVVLIAGSAVTMQEWIANAPAILMAWYPGMEGGNAIADIVFGDVCPSGRIPITFPKSEDQLPLFDSYKMDDVYSYYHGYRYFDKNNLEPLFPFGYGLSYTTFEYSNMKIDKSIIGLDGKVKVSVDVKNTGDVAGDEVVQLYIGYEGSKVERSVKDLKGFNKVFLQPGEKKTVTIEVAAENVSYYSAGLGKFVVEPITYNVLVGASSRDIRETGLFRISENQAEVDAENQKSAKTPGFEVALAFVALGAISIILRKKRL